MSKQQYIYTPYPHGHDLSAGPMYHASLFNTFGQEQQEDLDLSKPSRHRRDETNSIVDQLYRATYRRRLGEEVPIRAGLRRNKNEVCALVNSLLTKNIHLNGMKYAREIELSKGIETNPNGSQFLLVLRTDGRIVVMSEEAEEHLGKSMRSLYTQCINIFECLDGNDGEKLRLVLQGAHRESQEEHRLVCTFRLPKGKRPSRTRQDIKTITMAGHFYSCHDSLPHEKLFIARCEALVSQTVNGANSSPMDLAHAPHTTNSKTVLKFTLNDDMSVNAVSSNVEEILGYRAQEMIGNWFGRFLPADDLQRFESKREKYLQPGQAPTVVCDMFDVYKKNGDGRLTFLYQVRPKRERRAKAIRFDIVAQLVDPSLRNQYVQCVQTELAKVTSPVKAEQVNQASFASSPTSEDPIVATSPSLSGGLLIFDPVRSNSSVYQQQSSPFSRSLSNVVAPVSVKDEFWPLLYALDCDHQATEPSYAYGPMTFLGCQSDQELENILNDCLDAYCMNGLCF